ncbi:hypothetical protein HWV62_26060 [Athelia sp. TMB]|nr:hypothetical protein HWV62_26060 [Athelia sp. TMB]
MLFIRAALTGLLAAAYAATAPTLGANSTAAAAWTDPPFSISTDTMAAAITCPNGIQGKAGGIVFLVHGTASDGNGTWATGPYNLILPTVGPGYDICWVTLPGFALGNAEQSAEYVAYNIKALAAQSATKKVYVVGWSQGAGLNLQWVGLALSRFTRNVQ